MYKQERIKPYNGTGDKGQLVEEMFDNIADNYDTLNHRLSWNIDKGWRRKAITLLRLFTLVLSLTWQQVLAILPFSPPVCSIHRNSSEPTSQKE